MSTEVRETLERQRESILGALRRQMPSEVRELEAIDLAIKTLNDRPSDTEYIGYKRVVDAVVALLKRRGHKMTGDEIITAIVAGGGGRNKQNPNRDPRQTVEDSLRYNNRESRHIRVIGTDKQIPITPEEIEEAVFGLIDWPDEHP